MQIQFTDTTTGGYGQMLQVREGSTIQDLLESQGVRSENVLVRVNREEVVANYILKDNDKVTVTATNVKGA